MRVKMTEIREAYTKAKISFGQNSLWLSARPTTLFDKSKQFHLDFAEAFGFKIVDLAWKNGFPVFTEIEFESEEKLVMFLLEWA